MPSNPAALGETPPLEQEFTHAGFRPRGGDSVGVWVTHRPTSASTATEFAIDLLVPASISPGRGRRAARLPGHDARLARIVWELKGVIADADVMHVGAFDTSDGRELDVRGRGLRCVAGGEGAQDPGPFRHGAVDRQGRSRHPSPPPRNGNRCLAGRTQQLSRDDNARPVAEEALGLFGSQFANRAGEGIEMAVRAVGALGDSAEVSVSCEVLAGDLLRAVGR